MKDVREKVERILGNYPASRDDDKVLLVLVLNLEYGVDSIGDILKPQIPSPGAITRTRRRIQEEGHFLPSETAKEGRYKEREIYKELFAK